MSAPRLGPLRRYERAILSPVGRVVVIVILALLCARCVMGAPA